MTTRTHPLDDKENPSRAYEWAMEQDRQAEWAEFLEWEAGAAKKGSGLTADQLTGARIFHEWLAGRRR